jgi:peroxiredoxin
MRPIGFLFLLYATLSGYARADDGPPNAKLGKKIDNVTLKDSAGKSLALHDIRDKKAVVVVFLSFECPVSTSYSQPLANLHKEYGKKGVAFFGISCNPDEGAVELAKRVREFKLPFPVVRDDKRVAAEAFKAQVIRKPSCSITTSSCAIADGSTMNTRPG